ncbi:unannotated protein [freshwater metagenome]|uniref:Unannotated protein n=1 Tax=freshwater metagenome TaxID=449393 RepID=A0A6J7A759_9ZZZZ
MSLTLMYLPPTDQQPAWNSALHDSATGPLWNSAATTSAMATLTSNNLAPIEGSRPRERRSRNTITNGHSR